MQVAQHASQLRQLTSQWELLQFETAAELVEAAAVAGSIPPERCLTAAAALCDHFMHWLHETEPGMSHEGLDPLRAARFSGMCMRCIAGGAAAAAAQPAGAAGPWRQEAARELLSTTMQLCAWLLTPLAAQHRASDHGASACWTQQHVADLLADGGPVAKALTAVTASQRSELAFFFEHDISRGMPCSSPEVLPALALAARMLRMLCSDSSSGGGSQNRSERGPLSASCLGTEYGDQRLHVEVLCPKP